MDEAIALAELDARREFQDMIAKGETERDSPTGW